ncbi:MAG: GAF domain-containing protein [Sulfuricurvum sp.]|uniref:GAF domain-containing protein n=1 Tax=Sulfuricurvum sp. TaxID=2025608 RepID=UPI00271F4C50|nr:GAF domain-containing protein [Sulfuricurvum sp.]MDO9054987.1 GAF domain-containing protein [Sulfuricurvum sp.]MDP2851131.1 GAF domain-containing protein [Sulfuricurvum sp.]MDP3293038.1 GAF domain-containing protein [Sulfuricurvum sp.]
MTTSYTALADFGRALLKRPTLSEGLPMISEYAKQVSGAERCSIFIYNPKIQMLWTTLADGIEKIMVHQDDGIVGSTFKEGKPILVNNPYEDARFLHTIDNKTGFVTKNIASIPIFDSNRRIIGVFQLLNKPEDFSSEDTKFMIFFAHYISGYIELAMLYDDQGTLLSKGIE